MRAKSFFLSVCNITLVRLAPWTILRGNSFPRLTEILGFSAVPTGVSRFTARAPRHPLSVARV